MEPASGLLHLLSSSALDITSSVAIDVLTICGLPKLHRAPLARRPLPTPAKVAVAATVHCRLHQDGGTCATQWSECHTQLCAQPGGTPPVGLSL